MTGGQLRQTPEVCSRQGCDRPLKPGAFACAPDWYALPPAIRDEVWRSWRAFRRTLGSGTPEQREAARQAYAEARARAYAAWSA